VVLVELLDLLILDDAVVGRVSLDIDGFLVTLDVDVVDELDNESVDERRDVDVVVADVVVDAFWKVLRNDAAEFSSADVVDDFLPKLLGGVFFLGSSGRTPMPDSKDEWLFSSLPQLPQLPQLLLLLQLLKYPVDAVFGPFPAAVNIRITDGDWICKGWTLCSGFVFGVGVGVETEANLGVVSFLFAVPLEGIRPTFFGTGGGRVDV